MTVSEFCKAIHYNNLLETESTKELAEQLKNNLIGNYTRGRMATPYVIESQLPEDGCVILFRGARFLLDYRTNEVYVVKNVLAVPFGDYMRKMKPYVEDDLLPNQMEDYLLGHINKFTGGPDEEYAKKAGVEYDYVFQSYNKLKMVWYKKEEE